ncbi:uncharacterized protein cubi_02755 [Cryptosporidium ubiquitum]|uniref:Uncharacterized protein n=1 Tax=Cryptosporidium ubiquitum TaxID=857276 RepID=A0A1J4MI92_9CRYT|nr:uncharacterized protein cubi_02755 [Cryptosporidium ubiquitum]OII73953.1 hypothetical protein cubi_02755 [Cryptosporidium ubiquitum]
MSQEKWFVCKVKDFMAKRNTKISNLAKIYSDDLNDMENFFELPEKSSPYTLFMCYKLYSLFDPDNKGSITLKSVEEWAKKQHNSFCQDNNLNVDTKIFDKYKGKTQRICNSIETYKNNYIYHLKIKEGVEELKIDSQNIIITISEFISFISPLFDNIEDIIKKNQKSLSNCSAVHFAHILESNISLTNYFGTVTNTDPVGKFVPCTSSPSLYLEPKAKSVSRGESRPFKNSILYISDSNLYHSSLWSPCTVPASSSLHSMARELDRLQAANNITNLD